MKLSRKTFRVVVSAAIWLVAVPALAGAAAESNGDSYERAVGPFLVKHCLDCHGPDAAKARLRLDKLPAGFGAGMMSAVKVKRHGLPHIGKDPQVLQRGVRNVTDL